nr:Crp/Fnr family transcriptional regulator [Polymorphobacter sp.]
MARIAGLSPAESFARRGWLSGQPADFRAAVLQRVRWLTLKPGVTVLHAGGDLGGAYGVLSGGVGMTTSNEFNGPVLGHIQRTGAWFGYGALLTGRKRIFGVRTMEPTVLAHLSLAAMTELRASVPEATLYFGAMGEYGVDLTRSVIADLLIRRADHRIAATLLRATGVLEGITPRTPEGFWINQADLGEMANASRNHVNVTLQRFASMGWLTLGYGRIAIDDISALSSFAASTDQVQ